MKNMSFLLSIAAVIAVLGGITIDYYANGGATWISYVLFFGALAYAALVVARSVMNGVKPPKGPTAVALLLLLGTASCSRSVQPTGEARAAAAADTVEWTTTTTRQDNGFDATEKAW